MNFTSLVYYIIICQQWTGKSAAAAPAATATTTTTTTTTTAPTCGNSRRVPHLAISTMMPSPLITLAMARLATTTSAPSQRARCGPRHSCSRLSPLTSLHRPRATTNSRSSQVTRLRGFHGGVRCVRHSAFEHLPDAMQHNNKTTTKNNTKMVLIFFFTS